MAMENGVLKVVSLILIMARTILTLKGSSRPLRITVNVIGVLIGPRYLLDRVLERLAGNRRAIEVGDHVVGL
jgi:hypothetical protein